MVKVTDVAGVAVKAAEAATAAVAVEEDLADVVKANSATRVHLLSEATKRISAGVLNPVELTATCTKANSILILSAESKGAPQAPLSKTQPTLPIIVWLFEEVKKAENKHPELPSISKYH